VGIPARAMQDRSGRHASRLHFLFRWPATPRAVGAARRTVEVLPLAVTSQQLDELRLLISEVVTNAVLHGGVDVDEVVEMRATITAGAVRVEVRDQGHGFDPHPRPEPRAVGGLGMVVLDRMSRSWGIERDPEFAVWFEVDGGYRGWSRDEGALPSRAYARIAS
jgi:anti-sigma regulatory factor (Ser/Thr protein kinase)